MIEQTNINITSDALDKKKKLKKKKIQLMITQKFVSIYSTNKSFFIFLIYLLYYI